MGNVLGNHDYNELEMEKITERVREMEFEGKSVLLAKLTFAKVRHTLDLEVMVVQTNVIRN